MTMLWPLCRHDCVLSAPPLCRAVDLILIFFDPIGERPAPRGGADDGAVCSCGPSRNSCPSSAICMGWALSSGVRAAQQLDTCHVRHPPLQARPRANARWRWCSG